MYVCRYVCRYACDYLRMHVCMYVWCVICVCCMGADPGFIPHLCMYVFTYVCLCAYICMCVCIQPFVNKGPFSISSLCICVCCVYVHTETHRHTNRHTQTHTDTHRHTHTCIWWWGDDPGNLSTTTKVTVNAPPTKYRVHLHMRTNVSIQKQMLTLAICPRPPRCPQKHLQSRKNAYFCQPPTSSSSFSRGWATRRRCVVVSYVSVTGCQQQRPWRSKEEKSRLW